VRPTSGRFTSHMKKLTTVRLLANIATNSSNTMLIILSFQICKSVINFLHSIMSLSVLITSCKLLKIENIITSHKYLYIYTHNKLIAITSQMKPINLLALTVRCAFKESPTSGWIFLDV